MKNKKSLHWEEDSKEENSIIKPIALSRWKVINLENNKIKIVRSWLGFWYGKNYKALVSKISIKRLKCENCNHDVVFETWDLANTASFTFLYLLWVPIVEAEKKFYLICPNCRVGYEIFENDKNELRKGIISLFKIINDLKERKPRIEEKKVSHGLYDL